jgi:hypothetical protein
VDTEEVARERWMSFFDDFSAEHDGWVVSVETLGPDLGAQQEVQGLPLVGITAEVKGEASRIEISMGDRPDAHVTRIIESPKHVWQKQAETEGHEAIEIESDDGTKTLLRFEHVEQAERMLPAHAERDEI